MSQVEQVQEEEQMQVIEQEPNLSYSAISARLDPELTLVRCDRVLEMSVDYLSRHKTLNLYLGTDTQADNAFKTLVELVKKFTVAHNSMTVPQVYTLEQRKRVELRNTSLHRLLIRACENCERQCAALRSESNFIVARHEYQLAQCKVDNSYTKPVDIDALLAVTDEEQAQASGIKLVKRKRDDGDSVPAPAADDSEIPEAKRAKIL
tara:strand:- start:833 stop:1453 length:621 start_codon:yes stop_codon:yes gene_type:complete